MPPPARNPLAREKVDERSEATFPGRARRARKTRFLPKRWRPPRATAPSNPHRPKPSGRPSKRRRGRAKIASLQSPREDGPHAAPRATRATRDQQPCGESAGDVRSPQDRPRPIQPPTTMTIPARAANLQALCSTLGDDFITGAKAARTGPSRRPRPRPPPPGRPGAAGFPLAPHGAP